LPRDSPFDDADLEQLVSVGIEEGEALRQLAQLRDPPAATRVDRPCAPADGIFRLEDSERDSLLQSWRELVQSKRVVKFVPASGAASRMFKSLKAFLSDQDDETESAEAVRRLTQNLDRFAFYPELQRILAIDAESRADAMAPTDLRTIVEALLSRKGLDLGARPKGLIPFHRYGTVSRTAVAEHLFEGHDYVSDIDGVARFHFTVAKGTQNAFRAEVEKVAETLLQELGRSVEVEYSIQSPSTDTLSIDPDNMPFRLANGRLLLRPSGHGALIDNLSRLDADVVYVKNIDNIAPEWFHSTTVEWKRMLGGLFAKLQRRVFELTESLESDPTDASRVEAARAFLEERFTLKLPARLASEDIESQSRYVLDRLRRPLRVAGMVRNEREPGGGPFWVRSRDGTNCGQIVESSQLDHGQEEQQKAWRSATHLNPVDLVCGLSDRLGRPYPLDDYVDSEMAFVTQKSHAGRPLTALERPGLWNGSMAGWNTVFVEVPLSTFTPVKTVFDLLRPEHQPSAKPS